MATPRSVTAVSPPVGPRGREDRADHQRGVAHPLRGAVAAALAVGGRWPRRRPRGRRSPARSPRRAPRTSRPRTTRTRRPRRSPAAPRRPRSSAGSPPEAPRYTQRSVAVPARLRPKSVRRVPPSGLTYRGETRASPGGACASKKVTRAGESDAAERVDTTPDHGRRRRSSRRAAAASRPWGSRRWMRRWSRPPRSPPRGPSLTGARHRTELA